MKISPTPKFLAPKLVSKHISMTFAHHSTRISLKLTSKNRNFPILPILHEKVQVIRTTLDGRNRYFHCFCSLQNIRNCEFAHKFVCANCTPICRRELQVKISFTNGVPTTSKFICHGLSPMTFYRIELSLVWFRVRVQSTVITCFGLYIFSENKNSTLLGCRYAIHCGFRCGSTTRGFLRYPRTKFYLRFFPLN